MKSAGNQLSRLPDRQAANSTFKEDTVCGLIKVYFIRSIH